MSIAFYKKEMLAVGAKPNAFDAAPLLEQGIGGAKFFSAWSFSLMLEWLGKGVKIVDNENVRGWALQEAPDKEIEK